jgi:hypothetical protein
MFFPLWLRLAAAAAFLSSCAVKEEYSVAVDSNSGVSLEKREIISSWWGDVPKEHERPHPLGSAEGNDNWSASTRAAAAAEQWQAQEEQRQADNRFGYDR